ncbi:hypothetical protein A9Z42_0013550 [Trichoderma parareesei]|uniref:Uncharacterized protein n=1 Tax=Trichoderma parareesei TaxID=858221 RepID=A0A2H2ZNX9_TRIPA|nr:hypothetical protein A9Z42_0013550 [Trichoderma parareesei]
MTTREVAALISQSHPVPSCPGPVTSTTEGIFAGVSQVHLRHSRQEDMLMAILEPPQSLLAKQRNLASTASTDPTNEQNAAPVEDADKEVLVERVHNTGAQTPSSLAAQIEYEQQQRSST